MMCNGMLAGLVAITAPCAFVNPVGAAIIGLIAGVLVVLSVFFFEKRGVDDPVGAISVHGVNGLWGVLSVGIFATGEYGAGWNGVVREEMVKLYGSDGVRGLLYGDFSQFIMQMIDARHGSDLRLRDGLCVVQDQRCSSRRFASALRLRSKVLTDRRWEHSVIRTSSSIRDRGLWNSNTESRISPKMRLSLTAQGEIFGSVYRVLVSLVD